MKKTSTYQSGVKMITVVMVAILVILAILLISFFVTFIKEFSKYNTSSFDNIYLKGDVSSVFVSEEPSVSETSSETQSQEESKEPTPPPPNGVVPESEKVLSAYFSDAVFIGDSITDGIKLYGIMSSATVYSYTGLGLDNIYTKEVVDRGDGTKIPIMDAVKASDANKFYILIGMNSIQYSKENFVKKYAAIVEDIKTFHPDAIIYVQSITPLCEEKANAHGYKFSNSTVKEYNEALIEMVQEKGVYFLNINEALADESGALPEDVTTDGLHFGPAHYQKWFDYLKTHTVG